MKKWAGTAAVLASAAGFATVAIFIKYAYAAGASTFTVLTARFGLAALLLCAVALYKGIELRLSRKLSASLLLLGACGYGLMAILFAASLRFVSASIGALLLYAYPALVAILAALFCAERLDWRKGVSLLLCFAGLAFVLGISFESLSFAGIVLGLASALVYACYIVFSSRLLKHVQSLTASVYVCGAAALFCLVCGSATGSLNFDLPAAGWISLGGIAFFGTVVGILGFLLGMEKVGPANASIVSMVEPVITVLLSAALLGDRLTWAQFGGGSLILGGIVLLQLWAGKEHLPDETTICKDVIAK